MDQVFGTASAWPPLDTRHQAPDNSNRNVMAAQGRRSAGLIAWILTHVAV